MHFARSWKKASRRRTLASLPARNLTASLRKEPRELRTMRVRTTEEADRDIREIIGYFALVHPDIGLKFIEELWGTIALIADAPGLGAVYRDLKLRLRFVRLSRRFHYHLIFYREDGGILPLFPTPPRPPPHF